MLDHPALGGSLNILLIDDHELFREGIKLLLADLDSELSFAEAASCGEALALVETQRFDLVLLDLRLPDSRGLEALILLRARLERTTIVVLSAEDDLATIRQLIDNGAAGFIPKNSSYPVMIAALRLVLAGGTYLPAHVFSGVAVSRPAREPSHELQNLTERQIATLRLAIQGKANKVIARELAISEATVKAHLSVAFRVLGVRNRTEAVFAAAELRGPI